MIFSFQPIFLLCYRYKQYIYVWICVGLLPGRLKHMYSNLVSKLAVPLPLDKGHDTGSLNHFPCLSVYPLYQKNTNTAEGLPEYLELQKKLFL